MAVIATGHITISDLHDGKSVDTISVLYYVSTSNETLVDGVWSEAQPTNTEGKYVWSKTLTTYNDGSFSESSPVCITGTAGKGVFSIEAEYYLSTSDEDQVDGEWQSTAPEWYSGMFLWTRSKITYSDGSVSYTEPYCDTGWKSLESLVVGGKNYIRFSSDMTWEGRHGLAEFEIAVVDSARVDISLVGDSL